MSIFRGGLRTGEQLLHLFVAYFFEVHPGPHWPLITREAAEGLMSWLKVQPSTLLEWEVKKGWVKRRPPESDEGEEMYHANEILLAAYREHCLGDRGVTVGDGYQTITPPSPLLTDLA